MTRDLPDELLSAYLDGEVTAEERAAVEAHLAASPADRQLLDELQSLRGDMGALPQASVRANFADRVVQAAVAAKADADAAVAPASSPQRRWWYAAAGLAAVAASLFIAVQLQRSEPAPIAAQTPAEKVIAALHAAVGAEGQAAVLRVRIPKDVQLAKALADAGFMTQGASANTGAEQLGAAYDRQLRKQVGADSINAATITAADALFIESPLAQLERVFAALASDPACPLELRTEARLAFYGPGPGGKGEAEGQTPRPQTPVTNQPFVQQLTADRYRLSKTPPSGSIELPGPAAGNQQRVRVLILVERVDGQ